MFLVLTFFDMCAIIMVEWVVVGPKILFLLDF